MWLVADVDEGVLRRCRTRREAVRWMMGLFEATKVLQRIQNGPGFYEYFVSTADETWCGDEAYVMRVDVAKAHGFDPDAPARYPHVDDPYEYEV